LILEISWLERRLCLAVCIVLLIGDDLRFLLPYQERDFF
jgi:hypothetical protein